MKYQSANKPDFCPQCGSNNIAEYLYGTPIINPKLVSQIESGEVILGGCFTYKNQPAWKCDEYNILLYKPK